MKFRDNAHYLQWDLARTIKNKCNMEKTLRSRKCISRSYCMASKRPERLKPTQNWLPTKYYFVPRSTYFRVFRHKKNIKVPVKHPKYALHLRVFFQLEGVGDKRQPGPENTVNHNFNSNPSIVFCVSPFLRKTAELFQGS